MSETITSRQNVRIKEAVKLRAARQRAKQGRFLIDGVREICRALDAGIEVVEAFVCPLLCVNDEADQATARLRDDAAVVSDVTGEVFEKLCFGKRTEGVVVVAKTPDRKLEQLRLPPQPLVAVLEGLEKPGNVGAILRSADGAGFNAVIVAERQTDLFNPNTIRASMGTVFAGNVYTATAEEAMSKLSQCQVPILAARPDANDHYTDIDYRSGAAFVMGNEATGISSAWHSENVLGVRLPMLGIADSLNVSATAAVLFYEAHRQRSENSGARTPGR